MDAESGEPGTANLGGGAFLGCAVASVTNPVNPRAKSRR
jgi:hypothetical protein